MGYYSQVAIQVLPMFEKEFQKVLLETDLSKFNESEKDNIFLCNSIKWGNTSDVQTLMDFLDNIEKQIMMENLITGKYKAAHGFIRIGEDNDDYEDSGDTGYFDMSVDRSIYIGEPNFED
jgi:hypothetical protein